MIVNYSFRQVCLMKNIGIEINGSDKNLYHKKFTDKNMIFSG
jgi:hypothetical protein